MPMPFGGLFSQNHLATARRMVSFWLSVLRVSVVGSEKSICMAVRRAA
jgi:hypothetical protein